MRLTSLLAALLILAADQASLSATHGFTGKWPIGYRVYCGERPGECLPRKVAEPIDYLQWESTIDAVNRQVNASIKYRSHDEEDRWVDNPEYGNCEDYSLTKRGILIKRGFDPSNLLFVYVHLHGIDEKDALHVVLALRTNYGFKVMDNRFEEIYDLDRMTVDFAFMQDPRNPKNWVEQP